MTEAEAKRRFTQANVARLATVTPVNDPHLVPICFALDALDEANTIYSAVDAKPKTTPDLKRLRNIAANPSVTLLVDHYDDDWTKVWWVRVDGNATVAGDGPERAKGLQTLAAKYPQYAEGPDLLGRVVVIRPTKWTYWEYSVSV